METIPNVMTPFQIARATAQPPDSGFHPPAQVPRHFATRPLLNVAALNWSITGEAPATLQNMCSRWLIRGPAPWPPDRFAAAVASNISIGGVLNQLGCGVSGSNYRRVHNMVSDLELDTSHWLGAAHLRGGHHSWTPSIPLS